MANLFGNVLRAHQWLYEKTDGAVGHRLLFGNPTLLLRTVGRKSGRPRVSALTYGHEGDTWLVTASNGGSDRPPAWLHNVTARPECEIQIGRRRIPVTALPTLPDDPDYQRRWEIVNRANNDRYREYQKLTSRPIPVVVLAPR
ncbi:MAG: nitroreductase family deazaflavin-dependent oxidoreductase [Mycobacteriaceae bacterium]|nr:nitroreductase family deazaflavin-dependent oxidoreductase [Mycobacteriaceae bacterium]